MKKILITTLFLFILFASPVFAAVDGALATQMYKAENEGNYEKVSEIALQLMVKNPYAPDGFKKYAECMMRANKYDDAVVNFTNAIKNVDKTIQEDSAKLRKMGFGENSIKQTLNFDSTLYDCYFLRAVCYFCLQQYELAWADIEKSKQYSKETNFNAEYFRSTIALKSGKYKEASKIAKNAKLLATNEEDKKKIDEMIKYINNNSKIKPE